MKINYKQFTKHAEKMVKGSKKLLAARPILHGINHDENGNITVTDSHRLYHAREVNAPTNIVLHAITGEELDLGNYPDINRLIPLYEDSKDIIHFNDINKIIKLIKAMQVAGSTDGISLKNVTLTIKDNKLVLDYKNEEIEFIYSLNDTVSETVKFNSNYFLESLEMLKDMNIIEFQVNLYGSFRPFTITPLKNDNILALITPIRGN